MSLLHIRSAAIVFGFIILLFLVGCNKKEDNKAATLRMMASYPIYAPEISGLSWFTDKQHLLTVSDSLGKIYVINLSGQITDTLAYSGDNPEGITYDPRSSHIYVVEEKKKEIVVLDSSGMEMNRFDIPVPNIYPKHGPEGISLDTATSHLYVINEKSPGRMYKFTTSGILVDSIELNFAKDYSSVYFDDMKQGFWILSDESENLTWCNLEGKPLQTWNTNVNKAEGVVVDREAGRIYLVKDNDSRLFIFSL